MTIAYLINTYPATSMTFIRAEIRALELRGIEIKRYATRRWSGNLVDPLDISEQRRTHYLLTGNIRRIVAALAREIVINSRGVLRSLGAWFTLLRNARGGLFKHTAYLMEAAYFRQCAQANNLGHVHVHFSTNATAVAMLAHLMGGPSYSFTAHGPDEFDDPARQSFELKIRYASFVVAISDYCKRLLVEFSRPDYASKIHVVRCGLPINRIETAQPVTEDNQTLVCVGRLCPQKGQVLIPRAVAALRAEFPGLKVILVGDGESRSLVEAEIGKYGVGDIVKLRGWMINRDVLDLIRSSRALLLPSYAEGLPVGIMEAMAVGRPVISTRITGIPELVRPGENGWLVPAGDFGALVEAMRMCLISPADVLKRMGDVARESVLARHDIEMSAAALADLFQLHAAERNKVALK